MTNLNDLLIAVCSYYGIDIEKVKGKDQNKDLVTVRRVFCYLAKQHYKGKNSIVQIGKIIKRDHATVLHHHRIQSNFNDVYPNCKQELSEIMDNVQRDHYNTDISNRFSTAMGYLGLAYVFDMQVNSKDFF